MVRPDSIAPKTMLDSHAIGPWPESLFYLLQQSSHKCQRISLTATHLKQLLRYKSRHKNLRPPFPGCLFFDNEGVVLPTVDNLRCAKQSLVFLIGCKSQ